MKVRIKYSGQSHSVDLGDRATSTLTLLDLLQAVANRINLDIGDFNLSLNRSDFLSGNDTLLSDFGIVAGDLIYVLRGEERDNSLPRQCASQRSQPLALSSLSSNDGASTSRDNENAVEDSAGPFASAEMETGELVCEAMSQSDCSLATEEERNKVNRFLLEPLAVRESTADQVPALLNQLYNSAVWQSHTEALWVVLHTLMIESGFFPSAHEEHTSMPDGWKQQGIFMCNYDYRPTLNITLHCTVVGVTMGSSISVHGLSKNDDGFKTESLQLKGAHFVRTLSPDAPSTYRALDCLSRQFKDVICLPLINHLTRSAGLGEEQGLMALPCELRIRLLSYLDARSICHLGAICSHWNSIYKDSVVWRRLFLTYFGAPNDCSLGRNWYELYKQEYVALKEREEQHRRSVLFADHYHPLRPFPVPGGHAPFFPHILGGDYDLNPEFSSGLRLPDPMGQGLAVGPRLGLGPRFNPNAQPGSRGPMPHGWPRTGRRNLTGNPHFYF